MINLICKGGVLDGKMMAAPSNIYEFTVENLRDSITEKYVRFTHPDGFGNYLGEWQFKDLPRELTRQ